MGHTNGSVVKAKKNTNRTAVKLELNSNKIQGMALMQGTVGGVSKPHISIRDRNRTRKIVSHLF